MENQLATGFTGISYWLATAALTIVLVWGFRMLSKELQRPAGEDQRTLLRTALTEKTAAVPQQPQGGQPQPPRSDQGSFSRLAGSIGAIGIAATFVGISYWVLHTLFFDIGNLTKIEGLATYFLAGSAMFLPYAFNQLSSIFKL
jgi:hypothetical protein